MGKGRVTIPTDLDVVPQTLEMIEEWGADAIRDCDGTEFPQKQVPKFMQPTIQPVRTMPGRKHIRKKSSRCIL